MARIFTPEEISQGRIPDDDAPYRAANYIVERAIANSEPYGVTSGMVFGSTAMGTANRLSDVDVLFAYDSEKAHISLPLIGGVIREARKQFGVPVEELAYAEGTLTPRHRSLDPFLVEHWKEVQRQYPGQWSYRDPVKDWSPLSDSVDGSSEAMRAAIREYVTTKMDIYGYGMMRRDAPDLRKMQKALEFPRSLGRKILALTSTDAAFHVRASFEKNWTRDATWRWLASMGDDARVALAQFERLVQGSADYDKLLAATLDGAATVTAYSDWLRDNYFLYCKAAYDVCLFCRTWLESPIENV